MWNCFGRHPPQPDDVSPASSRRENSTDLTRNRPSYMSDMQLLQLLEEYYKGRVNIIEENVIPIRSPNTITHKFLIQILLNTKTGEQEQLALYVKMLMKDQDDLVHKAVTLLRLDEMMNIKKEIEVYNRVISKIDDFQKELFIEAKYRYPKLFAKCFKARLSLSTPYAHLPDQHSAILFKDLTSENFKSESIAKGFRGFDFDTARSILRDMAYFHACPIAMRQNNEAYFRKNIIPTLNMEVKQYEKLPPVEMLSRELISFTLKNITAANRYSVRIRDSLQLCRLYDWIQRDQEDKTWHTISHSRYWLTNIMINKAGADSFLSSKLLEMHRLGFKNCCTDLAFFLFTSVQPDILGNHFAHFLEEYYDEFNRILQVLDASVEKYTYSEFISQFRTVGQRSSTNILMNIKTSSCEGYDNAGKPILGNRYRKRMLAAVNIMIQHGWLQNVELFPTVSQFRPLQMFPSTSSSN